MKNIELLAPAGNAEGFYGAIHAGADAVYLGGNRFSARAYADNFDTETIISCIRYAHILGRRVYLTVNILLKEQEFPELYEDIRPLYEAGLDGVIVQDTGVLSYLKKHFPLLPLHASTQMTITGSRGAGYLKELGVCRVVPARELSLSEIRQMKQKTGLEIETFIHGAMCYCYSGQCLFSSMIGGRSGNRGRCAQPCRLPYQVGLSGRCSKPCYPLSLKDMCTIEFLPQLIEAGIDSFKIEGRMKKPEYAAGVTALYRKYIDLYHSLEDKADYRVLPEDLEALSGLYIRSGMQSGYYFKHNGADMVTLKNPAYNAVKESYLAQIREKYILNKPRIPVSASVSLKVGSPAEFLVGTDFSEVPGRSGKTGKISTAIAQNKQNEASTTGKVYAAGVGSVILPAQKQPLTEQAVRKQFTRTGDSLFSITDFSVTLEGDGFLPVKSMNELRRETFRELENRLMAQNGLAFTERVSPEKVAVATKSTEEPLILSSEKKGQTLTPGIDRTLTIRVCTFPQFKALAEQILCGKCRMPKRIYLESDLLLSHKEPVLSRLSGILDRKTGRNPQADTSPCRTELFVALPPVLRSMDEAFCRQLKEILSDKTFDGCMVRSLDGYAYLQDIEYKGLIAADYGFYLFNPQAEAFWQDKISSFCLPLELNAAEQNSLGKRIPAEKLFYGYLPVMITANCIRKTMGECRGSGKDPAFYGYLEDRMHKKFPVVGNCSHCLNTIYNSVPLSLHSTFEKEAARSRASSVLRFPRLDFTLESPEEMLRILSAFENPALLQNSKKLFPENTFTTGHEKRGVE